jgi:hypothetical protein
MARIAILLGIVGLIGIGGSGIAKADYERQSVGRDNRVAAAPQHQRVVVQRKSAEFKRGRHPGAIAAVPELDPSATPLALALLFGAAALVSERRRSRA